MTRVRAHGAGLPACCRMSVFTEFQTLRRLPKTQALVFSIHKYISPMASLQSVSGQRGRHYCSFA